jgi:hypothetical protein
MHGVHGRELAGARDVVYAHGVGLVGMNTMSNGNRAWRVALASAAFAGACAGEPSDEGHTQGATATESSAGEDPTMSQESGAEESGAEESGTVPSTCPAGDFGEEECELGDDCVHGDFDCACVCGYDEGGSSEPGYWECTYAREEEVLALSEATSVLDCVAKTMTTNATFVVDNDGGAASIDFTLNGLHGTELTLGDLHHTCSGICSDGEACPDAAPVTVTAGTSAELVHQFGPARCDFEDGIDLCTFCGTTGFLRTYWGLTGSGTGASGSTVFEVVITCP